MNYQFTSIHLTLDNISRSNQGHMTFKRLYLLNGASYQILYETQTHVYSKSYMVFQFTPITFDFGWHLKVKSRSLGVHWAVVKGNALLDSGAVRPRGLLLDDSH